MIGIISTNKYKLSEYEFVKPIERILKKLSIDYQVLHYKNLHTVNVEDYRAFIIAGTALKDFDYLNYLESFRTIIDKPVFGICAGAQIISLLNNGKLKDYLIIGRKSISFKNTQTYAYFLTSKIPVLDSKNIVVFAKYKDIPVFFKIKDKELYASIFHPEVYNQDLIENFAKRFSK